MKNAILLLFILTLLNCTSDNSKNENIENSEWSVNEEDVTGLFELFPLSLNPEFTSVSNTTLNDNKRVGIVSFGADLRVFPYEYVNRYEVINTNINGLKYAFSYCPITKSAIAFKRDQIFRASGFLYKDNMTPWDENTESIWSQMLGKGIKGPMKNNTLEKIPVLETTWGTVKNFYPNAKVLKSDSSSKQYKTPQEPNDENDDEIELPSNGELTFGVVENNLHSVHFFRYVDFQSSKRKDVIIQGQKFIVYGNEAKRVINTFKVNDFDSFQLLDDSEFPRVLKSNNIKYDIFGNSAGGISLEKPNFAYVAAWVSWVAFFDGYNFYPNP